MWYTIILLDKDGYTLADNEAPNLKEAKEKADNYLSDEWATSSETTHEVLGTEKVEIRNDSSECVWDKFYSAKVSR